MIENQKIEPTRWRLGSIAPPGAKTSRHSTRRTAKCRAAEYLAALTTDANELGDEAWSQLKPHCNWASEPWREAMSINARVRSSVSAVLFPPSG
jgi:hypothetical protein